MEFSPLADRLLVRLVAKEPMTESGLVLPDQASSRFQEGHVLAVGAGSRAADGSLIPLTIAVGDTVLFSRGAAAEVKVDGETLFVIREYDALGKIGAV